MEMPYVAHMYQKVGQFGLDCRAHQCGYTEDRAITRLDRGSWHASVGGGILTPSCLSSWIIGRREYLTSLDRCARQRQLHPRVLDLGPGRAEVLWWVKASLTLPEGKVTR